MTIEHFKNILVIDIETVASHKYFEELDERFQKLWEKKAKRIAPDLTPKQAFEERAGIYAEFGKIVVISLGIFFKDENGKLSLRVKALANDDEKKLLIDFNELINKKLKHKKIQFVAHNGKEFDFPYIARRMLINGLTLPIPLQLQNKKPWEINHIDTMQLWRFGDFKNFTSLDLLAAVFGLSTSKDDIDGSQVNHVYYQDNDLERIAHYCNKDVALTAQVYLSLIGENPIPKENITIL